MTTLRRHRLIINIFLTVLMCLWQIGQPLMALDVTWTGATNLQWDEAGNWTPAAAPTATDNVTFNVGTPQEITLNVGSLANSLSFKDAYTLTGGALAVGTGGIRVDMGKVATIDSVLNGTDGLVKTGGGALYLGGVNTYTGSTTINNGLLVIDHNDALGNDTSTVTVNGSLTRGLASGALVLAGTHNSGVNLTRNLALQGAGSVPASGAALISVGNNTISGLLSNGTGLINTFVSSSGGTLSMTDVNVTGTTLLTLGLTNSVGIGNYAINGTLTGTGGISKAGVGTLTLNPVDATGYTGVIKIVGGSVRVSSGADLGSNVGTGSSSVVDLSTDSVVLEVRSDNFVSSHNIYQRAAASSTVFVDHAIGSTDIESAINGTASFGTLTFDAGETTTFNSRNGYGATFTGGATVGTTAGDAAITTNMGGLLTFTGPFWNTTSTTARTMTITSTGNTLIDGSIMATGADHNFTKSGAGILTLTGTQSTFSGNVSVTAGILAITDFNSLNNNTSSISLGNASSTAGNLIIGATENTTAAGLITSKALIFNTTSASSAIYANQGGADPVVLNGTITRAAVTSSGGITLGGTNMADNIITSAIPQAGTGGVNKNGPGTWVLSGANEFTTNVTLTNGLLKIKDSSVSRNVINDGASVIFNAQSVTQEAGGTFEYVGANSNSAESVGALTLTAGAGTVKTTPSAGVGDKATLTFASLGTRTAGATVNYVGANESIVFTSAPTVTNGIIAPASSTVAFHTFNGVDWATQTAGKVSAYTAYTALPTTAFSGTTNSGVNYVQTVNGSTSGTASINTLKIVGGTSNPTLTLGGTLTLTAKGLLFDYTLGGATITGSQIGAASVETVIITNGVRQFDNSTNPPTPLPIPALTINSLIGSGTGSLTKSGTGTLVIGGANTYTGNTIINEGMVQLSGATATLGVISTAANLTTLRQGTILDINAAGASQTVTIGALTGAGTITNSGGVSGTSAATLSIGSTSSTAAGTFTGILKDGTGVLNVIKRGTGAQSLLGLSTYTGTTTIGSTGLVTVNSMTDLGQTSGIGAGSGSAANDAQNAANLIFNGSTGGLVYAGAILNGALTAGTVSTSTNRLFTLAGTGATLSSTVTNNNAIIWRNTGNIVHGITGPQTLTFGGTSTGDNTFYPRLTDSGTGANITSVIKTGTGVWNLAGSTNAYTGTTTISQGILVATSGQGLPTASNLVFDGGALYSQGTLSRNIGTGAGQMRFTPSSSTTAQFSGGFIGGDSKLTVSWTGTPVWGSTTGFLDNRNGLILNGSQARAQGATTAMALSEVDIAGNFSLGSATGGAAQASLAMTTTNSSANVTVDTTGLVVGQSISGINIPAGAYIVSINSATQVTISANTASSGGATGTGAVGALAMRTIRVDDNTNTAADYATISGIISGNAGTGLRKVGSGTLQLMGKNTYSGETNLYQGTLTVNSLGRSTDAVSGSSLGTNVNANLASNALTMGNGGTGAGILQYVGAGETSDRMIRLNTSTGNTQIHADGSGALVLTNIVNDMVAGAKILYLRGSNTMGNMITSPLTNYNSGADALALTIDGNATWILAGNSTYTGQTTITSGAVGIGHVNAFGASTINLRNGSMFAYGEDRTLANTWFINSTTTSGTTTFFGDYSIIANGAWTYNNQSATQTFANSISTGKSLTLNGAMPFNSLTSAVSLAFNGSGTTNLNSAISTDKAFGVNLSYTGNGTLNIGGINSTGGSTTVNNANGILRVKGAGKLGTGNLTITAGNVYFESNASVNHSVGTVSMGASALLDIASTLTLTPTAITATGTTLTAATISGAGTLALGSGNVTVTVADNTGLASDMVWTINTLTGSGSLVKAGAGTLDISGITNNNFSGTYQITAGDIIGLNATSNLVLNGGVFSGNGTFTRSIGTGSGQVQWLSGGGGFAAVGGNLSVTLSSAADPLVWGTGGTANFVPDGAPLIFGSALTSTGVVTFNNNINLNAGTRVVSVVDNPSVTTDKAVIAGNLTNGTLNKTGNGILELSGTNTLTGITLSTGTLQFKTVSNTSAGSNLGNSSTAITVSGGVLSFIADGAGNSQTLNRVVNVTATAGLGASGTNDATMTYAGGINANAVSVTLSGTGQGFVTGGFTHTSAAPDLVVASGNWTFSGTSMVVGDELKVNGVGTVANLNATGVLGYFAGTSNNIFVGNGGTVNVGDNNAFGTSYGIEGVYVGYETAGADATLNMNGFSVTVPRIDIGQPGANLVGHITGTGTINVTTTTAASSIQLYAGSVSAKLAGAGTIVKTGMGTVTLSGDNSGLNGTVTTQVNAGTLILDYTNSNTLKISAGSALSMSGGNLTFTGSAAGATTHTFPSLALAGGANMISVTNGFTRSATVNVGTISRSARTGTIRFEAPDSGFIKSGSANGSTGLIGTGTAFATVTKGGVTSFAQIDGDSNIVAVAMLSGGNDVSNWTTGAHITDETTGFTGTVTGNSVINSLRFNAAGGSGLLVADTGILNIASGGILQTSNVAGPTSITSGRLISGTSELVFITDSLTHSLQVGSSISGTQSITKSGAGTLHLNGANFFSAATNLQNGTLRVSGGNAIGDLSLVTLADDHTTLLELQGNETIGGLAGGSATAGYNALATVSIGTHALTLNQTTSTPTYLGLLTGSGTLIKTGTGIQELEGASTGFTGRVIVNGGTLHLDSTVGALINATSFTVNGPGSSLYSDQDQDSDVNRIGNSAPITLNNTAGGNGLYVRNSNDLGATRNETVGVVTLGGGHNVITAEPQNSTAGTTARLTSTSLTRNNKSTLLVRGTELGATSGIRGQVLFSTAPAGSVGGTGATATTLSIVPYIIGDGTAGSVGLGNSFVTNTAVGLRVLANSEYVTDAAGYAALGGLTTSNVRFVTDPGVSTTLAGKVINSLVMDSTAGSLTLTGVTGNNLTLSSGALLSAGANATRINGFANLLTSTSEYIIYSTNAANVLTLESRLSSTGAALVKSGAGTLALTHLTNTYGGGTWFNQGTIEVSALGSLGTGSLNFYGGALRWATGTSFDASTRTTIFGVGGATFDTNGNDVILTQAIGGGGEGGFTKAGLGKLTLNVAANYLGDTTISAGTLAYGVSAALPTATNLTLGAATLDIGSYTTTLKGLTLNGANPVITGTGSLTFEGDVVNAGGSRTLTVNNTGGVTFDGDYLLLSDAATTATLTLNGSGNVTVNGVVTDGGAAASGLTYSGTGTLTLNSTNTYSSFTTIENGTVAFGADQNLLGGLRMGSANTVTTPGVLDLTAANATFGGAFTMLTNSTTASEVKIGATKTLTINNNVALGSSAAGSDTAVNFTGGGKMVVTNTAAASSFIVGSSATNATLVDMSGLSSLNISLNTTNGVLRVNPTTNSAVSGKTGTLILPTAGDGTTTVTVATLAVGDSATNNSSTNIPNEQVNKVVLGSGVNTFNVNTINIGTGGRDSGSIAFNSVSTDGSIIIRNAAGTGAAVFNMGTGSASTAVGSYNTFDVSGHNADLKFGAVTIGTQNARTGTQINLFSFDEGTLDMSSLTLSSKGATGTVTSNFNIGGGTVLSGLISMAATTTATSVAIANLNITGGNVTLSGNIVRVGGSGTSTANFLLTGNNTVLDMGNNTLGGSGTAKLTSIVIEGGTLKNVAEFNGGDNLVKTTTGTLTFDGTNTYTGNTELQEGTVIAAGGANNRLAATGLTMGSGTASATLQLGTSAGASSQTLTSLSSSGTGTGNAIYGGNAANSTLTVNQSVNTTFNGSLGGSGTNQNNLNLVKSGSGELVINGARSYTGSTTVSGGKLFIDGVQPLSNTMTSLTLADNTEFSMRGTSSFANVIYDFSGTGNVITVGNGATLGFALDGGFNTQLNLATGQSMQVTGTLTTAIYVNNAPTAGLEYVLINGADDDSIFGSGSFSINPVVFNGGSFTYALTQKFTGLGEPGEQWVLTPTAQAAAADVWWKGDLTGIATGVWSASLTSGDGFPTNWATTQAGGTDALVPPDSGSIVHFSATGAANFATTLGANLTIRELIFHSGGTNISIGSSGGTNTLTLGNATQASGLTLLTGAPDVSISANVSLAKSQTWNLTDMDSILTISGNLGGTGLLTINGNGTSSGTLILSGPNGRATLSGGIHLVAGKIILAGGDDDHMSSTTALALGDGTTAATLQLGDSSGASNNTIGNLSSSTTAGNAIIGGNAAVSTLTVVQATTDTFQGVIGGAGTNQNNVAFTKQGDGTLILNGVNTYTGLTTVNAGTLQMGAAGSISTEVLVNASAGKTAILDINGRALTLNGITFSGADATSTSQVIDSANTGTITLGGNVLYDGINNPLGATLSAAVNLGAAARTFTANASTSATTGLTVSGAISTTVGAVGANGVGITLDGTGSGLISGGITLVAGTTDGGTADLTKNGSGSWTINSVVTVVDDHLINAGTLTIETGGRLTWAAAGSTSQDLLVDTTAAPTLDLKTADAIVGSTGTNRIFIRDGSTILINAENAIGASIEQLILGDNSNGIGNLVMNFNNSMTNGTLTVGFDNTTEAGFITGSGTLSGLATLNLNTGTISAALSSAAGNVIKDHTTTMNVSGNNTLGTGSTTVREGILNLDFTTNNLADSKIGNGVLTMGILSSGETSAILRLTGNATGPSTQTVTDLVSAGGPSEIQLISNGGQDTVLHITGALSRTNGTVNFNLPSAQTQIKYTGSATNVNGMLAAWMNVNTNDFAKLSGTQIVAATYTTENSANAWGVNGNITSSAAMTGTTDTIRHTINSLRFNAAAVSTVTVADTLTIASGGVLLTSTVAGNATTITGGNLQAGADGFFFHQNSTGLLTVASNLIGGSNLTKNGTGTMLLSGTNVTGTINIDEGILRVSGGNAISDTSAVNIRNISGARLELTNSETIGSLSGGTSSTVVIAAAATLTLNQTAAGTFAGVMSGTGSNLVKNGTATLTINGDNSLSGTLTINGGRITMSGSAGSINDVTAYILNGGELHSAQDQASNVDRIRNTSTITMNNTGGTSGLIVDNSHTTSSSYGPRSESVGAITLGYGANVITATPTTDNSAISAELVAASISQGSNRSTLLVRGLNLGNTTTIRKGLIRSDAAIATVGGTGTAGQVNIAIVPWIIGTMANSTTWGNSFVTYDAATKNLRPLLSTEYNTATEFDALTAATPSTNNVRLTATVALTGTASAINSLVIDAGSSNSAAAITGPTNSIEITSGAILSTTTGTTPAGHTLSAFATGGITTGGGRDYNIYVTGAAAHNLTINSPLLSVVPLVKSGAGILTLGSASNAFTDVYLNQGLVSVDNLNKLGTGTLYFHGGGIRVTGGFTGDLSSKTWNIGTGGGVVDVSQVTTGTTLANGVDDFTAGSNDVLIFETRSSSSTGLLTIQGSSTFTGTYLFNHGGVNGGGTNSVVLNGDTNAVINGNLEIGDVTNNPNDFDVVMALGKSEQIVNTATLTMRGASGENSYFKLMGFTETLAGIIGTTNEGVIENLESAETGVLTNGKLIVNSSQDYSYRGYMRNKGSGGSNTTRLEFEKQGTGTQTLVGSRITYTGQTTVTGGTLRLTDTTAFASSIENNSKLEIDTTAATTWTSSNVISGTGSVRKTGAGTFIQMVANTYAGETRIMAGTMLVNNITGSGTGTGDVFVTSLSTLGGTGRISGAVTVADSGILSPGTMTAGVSEIGRLTVGTLTANTDSTLFFQIGGNTVLDLSSTKAYQSNPGGFAVPTTWTETAWAAGTHDQLVIENTSVETVRGTVTVSFTGGYSPQDGEVFHLVDWASLNESNPSDNLVGTEFFNLPALAAGLSWNTNYFATHGILFVTPEPSRMMLLFFGLMGLFFRRRRR
ncbi:putative secreted protein with PEP-CTERM sorting signal [Prosthecobacter fusiformis]|uniref:Putative secreted protein with PEP-CTERM sorting signal n=1 Tax=Prosthecobacter fusiformis TaxID=48464 RepID=A0A4V3FE10_9BACT|nr:autotransporter-associated beta strand repeat-containing protein [Prosthecobacter fusiformis]TDU64030.1 putative secreted protein with PEP-CTERM sorting signal [Prosthecobacter fusiformis]